MVATLIENSYYTQEFHGPYELFNLGDFKLEEGGVIPNCQLAYATYGELNEAKNNTIVIPTWFSGTNKAYEPYIGEGRALARVSRPSTPDGADPVRPHPRCGARHQLPRRPR